MHINVTRKSTNDPQHDTRRIGTTPLELSSYQPSALLGRLDLLDSLSKGGYYFQFWSPLFWDHQRLASHSETAYELQINLYLLFFKSQRNVASKEFYDLTSSLQNKYQPLSLSFQLIQFHLNKNIHLPCYQLQ